jgi:hypothetical protein
LLVFILRYNLNRFRNTDVAFRIRLWSTPHVTEDYGLRGGRIKAFLHNTFMASLLVLSSLLILISAIYEERSRKCTARTFCSTHLGIRKGTPPWIW